MEKHREPIIQVIVIDYRGGLLPKANVTIRGLEKGKAIVLKFDERQRAHVSPKIKSGRYLVTVSARGRVPEEREIQAESGPLRETFILGMEGMPFYFRGRTKVPFEPKEDLLGVSLQPNLSENEEEDFLAYASELGLELQEVGEPIHADFVRVFRFSAEVSEEERRKNQGLVEKHKGVRRAGPVIRIDEESVSFLTNELIVKFNVEVLKEEIPAIAKRFNLEVIREIPYAGNAFLLRTREQASYALLRNAENLVELGVVEYVEPNLVTTAVDDFTPNDFLFGQQPHHQIINTEGAWDITLGDDGIVIAVVDSGCDFDHPEFSGDVAPGVTKVHPGMYNFSTMASDPTSGTHGTKSSGIATAKADNSEGIAGVAPGCRLLPIRRPSGGTDTEYSDMYIWIAGFNPNSITPGFPLVISSGADVITSSFGLSQPALPGIMKDALDFITTFGRNGKGCIVTFSVGNSNNDFTTYRQWAAYEKTIAVASSAISPPDAAEVKVSTSSFGTAVDVCAPGGGISGGAEARTLSTTNVGSGDTTGSATGTSLDYDDFGQTSCACPQVAGVAALMLSANSDLTWVEVRQILRDTAVQIDAANADPVGQWIAGYSQWYGFGRIDANAAVNTGNDYLFDRDIVVRDNLADLGMVATASPFWNSPDIWVRNSDPAVDGAAAFPANYGDAPPHQNPIPGQVNWIYTRFKNIGMAASYDFYIRVYLTHWAGLEFVYPDDFIPTTRPSDPLPIPLTPSTYLIGEFLYSDLAAGANDILNIPWPVGLIPPETVMVGGSSVTWHPCLLVEISPHDGPAPTGNYVWDDNNLAQKNIAIDYIGDDDAISTAVVIGNQANSAEFLELIVDRGRLPRQVQVYVEILDRRSMSRLREFVLTRNPYVIDGCCRMTFLEETRLMIDCAKGQTGQIQIKLPANTQIELTGSRLNKISEDHKFTLGTYQGREVVWLSQTSQIRIPIFSGGGAFIPIIVGGVIKEGVLKGSYPILLTQQNPDGLISGGIELQWNIGIHL